MLTENGGAVSRRGQWRDQIAVYSPNGGTDPGACVYRMRVYPAGGADGHWDYGYTAPLYGNSYASLDASSNDGTGRLVPVATDDALILNWLFSAEAMRALCPGSYTVSITASLADETTEIANFTRVVS